MNKPLISYAITVCSELKEFENLLDSLSNKIPNDNTSEIVILCDSNNGDVEGVKNIYEKFLEVKTPRFKTTLLFKHFEFDFAEHKNFLNRNCSGKWILQLDADEDVTKYLIKWLIEYGSEQDDILAIPRINIVDGLTARYADLWGWKLSVDKTQEFYGQFDMLGAEAFKLLDSMECIVNTNDMSSCGGFIYNPILVNYPDYQLRFYKNDPKIKWSGKVHEQITGSTISLIETSSEYSIIHKKSINKQIAQNKLYDDIQKF